MNHNHAKEKSKVALLTSDWRKIILFLGSIPHASRHASMSNMFDRNSLTYIMFDIDKKIKGFRLWILKERDGVQIDNGVDCSNSQQTIL